MINVNCKLTHSDDDPAYVVKIDSHRRAYTALHEDGYTVAVDPGGGFSHKGIGLSKEAFDALFQSMKDAKKARKGYDRQKKLKEIISCWFWVSADTFVERKDE